MAEAPAPAGGGTLSKELGGQPLWIWLVGAGVVVVGYIIIKHRSGTPAAATGVVGGGGRSTSSDNFTETIREWQSSPKPKPRPKPPPPPPPHKHHHHKHDDDDKKHHRKHHHDHDGR